MTTAGAVPAVMAQIDNPRVAEALAGAAAGLGWRDRVHRSGDARAGI